MADGFEMTPATLRSSASSLSGPASDLRQKASDISSTVGSGNPWGADEQGTLFGSLYSAVLSHAIETLASHADNLDYAVEALGAWADTHEQNDQQVDARFRAVGGASWRSNCPPPSPSR